MIAKRMIFTIGIVLLLITSAVQAEVDVKYESMATIARQEGWLAINSGASSVSIAVMADGKIVYSDSFGMADRQIALPVNSQTVYGIGSVSKAFAGVAILQLCERGLVALDKPVLDYIPEFYVNDSRYKDITVRMLLNHTSGLPGSNIYRAATTKPEPQYVNQTLAYLKVSTLKSNPGEISVYCNDGFTLAQAIVERVSKLPYTEYLQKNVFAKAGMTRSGGCFARNEANIARNYSNSDGMVKPLEFNNSLGSGGITSTPEDMCKFAQALITGKLLGPKMFAEMCTNQTGKLTNPEMPCYFNYGLGLDYVAVAEFESQGITVIAKNGGIQEYHSQLFIAPKEKISLMLLISGATDPTGISTHLMQAALEAGGYIKHQQPIVELPQAPVPFPSNVEQYAGYYGSASEVCKVSFDNKKNTLDIAVLANGEFVHKYSYFYNDDGYFHLNQNLGFKLVTANNCRYIMFCNLTSNSSIVKYEWLNPASADTSLFDDSVWLPANCKADDMIIPETVFRTGAITGLPGRIYLSYSGTALAYGLSNANTSEMILPHARDLVDLQILAADKQKTLRVGNIYYTNSLNITDWKPGESIVVAADGSNTLRCIADNALFLCDQPVNSRIIIFSADGSIIFDSMYNALSRTILAKGSFLLFAGDPGTVFHTSN